ncbi:hypothetical protein [Novispirillum itersonii]|uniref:Uncharacterized protein n=1 Tax=Novispirillum itersonii TaxID=189 RepID=A0A7W9ZHF7_NOVIT|nr:hypothetical protein [Novispirillum itersonii]MBB6211541.1 hypothetical protein [Novispirillum itersonii]
MRYRAPEKRAVQKTMAAIAPHPLPGGADPIWRTCFQRFGKYGKSRILRLQHSAAAHWITPLKPQEMLRLDLRAESSATKKGRIN